VKRVGERGIAQLPRAFINSTPYGPPYEAARFALKHRDPIKRALAGKTSLGKAGSEILQKEVEEKASDAIIDTATSTLEPLIRRRKNG
jgi:hypothetical protein